MDDLGAHTHERLRPSPVAPVSRRLAVAVGRPAPPNLTPAPPTRPRRSGFSRDRGDTGPRGHQEQNRTASALAVRCGSRPSDAPKGRAGADQDETWDPAASRPGIAAL